MARTRLYHSEPNIFIHHSTENIVAKLNGDLTDVKRKSFLKIILSVSNPERLLLEVHAEWQQMLLKLEKQIFLLKEKIRVTKNCIDTRKRQAAKIHEKQIAYMKTVLSRDKAYLKVAQDQLEKSLERANKSLDLLAELTNDMMLIIIKESNTLQKFS